MKILFDQGTPAPLRHFHIGHTVDTVFELDWSTLQNGALLDRAEEGGYHLLVTTDQNIRHQQNLNDRAIAILVLGAASWPRTRARVDEIRAIAGQVEPGQYIEIPLRKQQAT